MALDKVFVRMQGICSCLQKLCAVQPCSSTAGDLQVLSQCAGPHKLETGALAVAEAGARLTCRLLDFRQSPQSQSEHACALVAPPLAVLSAAALQPEQIFAMQQAEQNAVLSQLQVCLRVVSTTIRFLEDPSATESPHHQRCVTAAVERAWPVLQALAASSLAKQSEVSTGISEVVSAAFAAAGEQRGALVQPSLETLHRLFSVQPCAPPLESVAKMAELSGEGSGVTAEQLKVVHQGLVAFVQAAHAATSPPNDPDCDVIAAMLTVLARWACFHPLALLEGGLLDSALEVATGAACRRERSVVQNALGFLLLLLTPNRTQRVLAEQHAPQAAALRAAVAARADRMVCALLASLCDMCPWDSSRSMGRVLFHLLTSPGVCDQAMPAAQRQLAGGSLVDQQSPLKHEDCLRFGTLCLKAAALQERRFTAAVMDFGKIAHGQADSDSLLAYEMA